MIAQARPFCHPPADAEVGVVALREHPAVAAGHDAELDPGGARVPLLPERAPGHVPLERDPPDDPVAEAGGSGDDAVRAVRADEIRRAHARSSDAGGDFLVVELELRDRRSVPEVGACGSSLLGEMRVEPAPLRHRHERSRRGSIHRRPVRRAHDHPVDDSLDHGLDVARQVAQRSARQTAPARLVAGKARLVDEDDTGAGPRELHRRRGSGRAGSDHQHVGALHAAIVGARQRAGQRSLASQRRRIDTRGADARPSGQLRRRSTEAASSE